MVVKGEKSEPVSVGYCVPRGSVIPVLHQWSSYEASVNTMNNIIFFTLQWSTPLQTDRHPGISRVKTFDRVNVALSSLTNLSVALTRYFAKEVSL